MNKSSGSRSKKGKGRIAIILPYFNDAFGLELYENVKETLLKKGIPEKNITLFRVPGALELPLATQKILKKFNAVIALGIVIKGDTYHFELVCNETYRGLMDASLKLEKPVIFGVLTVKDVEQAKVRISKKGMNKGAEFAESALEMLSLLNSL